MANNVAITPGTGATVATDEVVDATLGTVQVQYLKLMDGTNDGTNKAVVDSGGGLKVTSTAAGDVASGATDSGNPIKIGGLARSSNPTAVSNAQRVGAMFDTLGRQVTVGALRQLKATQKTSITSASETTVITAGGSGVYQDVFGCIITNKSATNVFVDFRDSTGAGFFRWTLAAPANDSRGFMLTVDSAVAQGNANNNWTAQVSSAVTSIEISMFYVSNAQ